MKVAKGEQKCHGNSMAHLAFSDLKTKIKFVKKDNSLHQEIVLNIF